MKKGFTLIELLAVIVILAIIALIATPIVLSIINDSKESATLRSAEYYLEGVEISISTEILKNRDIEDGIYYILENGNICLEDYNQGTKTCKDNDKNVDNNELKVDEKGEKPSSGTITIKEGKIENIELTLGEKTVIKNNKGELIFGEYLTNYIKKLYNETTTITVNEIEYSLDVTHGLMNDRLGSNEVSKLDGNIRYYGSNPHNYIDIGDRDSNGNIIFWRIIGVFKDIEVTDENDNVIKTEDLVKIMRADSLISGEVDSFSRDYTSTGSYYNNWQDSTLQEMLNDEKNGYYGSGTTNYYNWVSKQQPTPTTLNFESTGLSSETYDKIARVNWNLGGSDSNSIYTDVMYVNERLGNNKWSGKIALRYASDYGYSVDLTSCSTTLNSYNSTSCKNANWMHDSIKNQWTLTNNSAYPKYAFAVYPNGRINHYITSATYGVRPVLYLNSNVGIVEENETSEGLKYFVVK